MSPSLWLHLFLQPLSLPLSLSYCDRLPHFTGLGDRCFFYVSFIPISLIHKRWENVKQHSLVRTLIHESKGKISFFLSRVEHLLHSLLPAFFLSLSLASCHISTVFKSISYCTLSFLLTHLTPVQMTRNETSDTALKLLHLSTSQLEIAAMLRSSSLEASQSYFYTEIIFSPADCSYLHKSPRAKVSRKWVTDKRPSIKSICCLCWRSLLVPPFAERPENAAITWCGVTRQWKRSSWWNASHMISGWHCKVTSTAAAAARRRKQLWLRHTSNTDSHVWWAPWSTEHEMMLLHTHKYTHTHLLQLPVLLGLVMTHTWNLALIKQWVIIIWFNPVKLPIRWLILKVEHFFSLCLHIHTSLSRSFTWFSCWVKVKRTKLLISNGWMLDVWWRVGNSFPRKLLKLLWVPCRSCSIYRLPGAWFHLQGDK